MMDTIKFAEYVGGEAVAGCVIGVVDGKKQYLYRDGEVTEAGKPQWLKWQDSLAEKKDEPKKREKYAPKE